MMHKIYSDASHVLIWLGPDETGGGAVAKLRAVVAAMRQELGHDVAAVETRLEQLRDGERAEKEDLPLIHAIDVDSWLSLQNIVSRAYWQRLWEWQEVMAAQHDAMDTTYNFPME